MSTWVLVAARVLSVLGHPLLTTSLFAAVLGFSRYPPAQAALLTAAVVGGVVLPLTWWNLRGTRRGQYTNFDVSDRGQRHSMYPVLLGLQALIAVGAWLTHQPRPIAIGLTVGLGLTAAAALINRWLKCSLHAALSCFLAGATLLLNPVAGGVGLALAALVSASRVVLRRHSPAEVGVGAALGLGAAAVLWRWL